MNPEERSGISSLPYVTVEHEGVGGELKSDPLHFQVEEIPLYEPEGKGDHIYFNLTRSGYSTKEIAEKLKRLFRVYDADIGFAGLKDKHALTTQSFSVYLANQKPAEAAKKVGDELPVTVNWAKKHRNKLKTGHLIGNRFKIILTAVCENAFEKVKPIAESLEKQGFANYFGIQRFGTKGDNASNGKKILQGETTAPRWLRTFLLSSYTSLLFNDWLADRIGRGDWLKVYQGDIAKKVKTGGIFPVKNSEEDQSRLEDKEITTTGPIFGSQMKLPEGKPGKWEREILEREGISLEQFKPFHMEGNRRAARVFVDYLSVSPHSEGLNFEFSLPKGAYATTVMREFSKNEVNFCENGENESS